MKYKRALIIVLTILLGLSLWLIRPNPSLANKEDTAKEKIPKGLKTKIQSTYRFVEDSGEFKKVLKDKRIYKYDDKGNQIE
ncbi:MAG: hypothetical protein QME51_06105, partial [Planctomycetota bacterium]|nr:hypothetical protein [Planctomycetota bacterium]